MDPQVTWIHRLLAFGKWVLVVSKHLIQNRELAEIQCRMSDSGNIDDNWTYAIIFMKMLGNTALVKADTHQRTCSTGIVVRITKQV